MTELATTDRAKAAVVIDAAIARVKQGWTQDTMARDEYGDMVCWDDPEACQWCLVGALNKGGESAGLHSVRADFNEGKVPHRVLVAARNAVREVIGDYWIATWNDTPGRTSDEVVTALVAAKRVLPEPTATED